MMRGRRSTRPRGSRAILPALLALAIAAPAAPAAAAPSVWARASDPRTADAESVMRMALKADLRFHEMGQGRDRTSAPLVLRDARAKLGELVAAGVKDF